MNMLEKRTKIVATIGPASDNPETLLALLRAGVNVFRLNFSHSNPDAAKATVDRIRVAREVLKMPVAIMADIKGPAVRMYGYASALRIEAGTLLKIQTRPSEGIESLVSPDEYTVYTTRSRSRSATQGAFGPRPTSPFPTSTTPSPSSQRRISET